MSVITYEEKVQLALNSAGIVIDDPTSQDGLIEQVPEGIKPIEIVNTYRYEPSIRCSFCSQQQPHKKGATIKLDNGMLACCGNCCVDNRFGKGTWELLKAEFEDKRKKVIYDVRIAPLEQQLHRAQSLTSEWQVCTKQIQQFRKDFERVFPDLFAALRQSYEKGGSVLSITETTRNHETGKTEFYNKPIAQFSGGHFLSRNPDTLLRKAHLNLNEAFRGLLAKPEMEREYKVLIRAINLAKEYFQECSKICNAMEAFCEEDNMRSIVHWARLSGTRSNLAFDKRNGVIRSNYDFRSDDELALPAFTTIKNADLVVSLLSTTQ